MKAGKEHRVPLCGRAVEILRGLERKGLKLFPVSDTAVRKLARKLAGSLA
jgi:hypothetical protein